MAYEGDACERGSDGTESMSASPVAGSPGSPCDPFQLDSGDEDLASMAADEVHFTTPVRQTEQQYFSPVNRVLEFDTCSEAPAAAPTLVQQLDGDLQLPSNSGMLAQCQAVSMERVRRSFADLSSLKPGLPPPLFHRGPSVHFQRSGPGVPTTNALAVQTLARPRISLNEPRFLNLEVPQPKGLPAPCFVGRQLGISALPAGAAQALPALAPLGAGCKTPKPRYFARQPPQHGFSIPATSTLESAVDQENDVKNVLIAVWVSIILPLARHSPLFSSMGGDFTKHLRVLLGGSSTGTLRRHMPGWKLWLEFSANAHYKDLPSLPDVLDFLEALLSGQVMDRGSGKSKVRSVRGPLSAMRFVCYSLQLRQLCEILENRLVSTWAKPSGPQQCVKEASPLPLYVIANMERAAGRLHASDKHNPDLFLLLCALAMMWGALRWSDLQRVWTQEVSVQENVMRGFSWRTKSSRTGMPWGILSCGIYDTNWGNIFCQHLSEARDRDFIIPLPGTSRPAGYAWMLSHVRILFHQYGQLSVDSCSTFTLHSLKATQLSWALQLEVPEHQRAALGHHRCRGDRAMVAKYSRDDVLPALRAQFAVIQAIRKGWVPLVAQNRGARAPMVELPPEPGFNRDLAVPNFMAVPAKDTIRV
ncbi:unnamed protein product [Polarella glacialis]|uniref:Uncharacterized protein n=1 Tax=Polarella glacialis TaxID=89957 RepID=A0A813K677_POLGL|nr:unnamed protein product [Polarella glacialis]